jgi:WS/DGAT/MGAT family acyltransferase
MRKLTNLDASFLHLEHAGAPMHVGGTLLFEAPADGPMTFERLRTHVGGRLHTARAFHERLWWQGPTLLNPCWVSDTAVDLTAHLRHVRVPAPLDMDALDELRREFFSELLPRDRPLWNMVYVEEAAPPRSRGARASSGSGRFAILLKVHHAAVDGISAEALLMGLVDLSPAPRALPAPSQPADAPPARRRLGASLRELLQETDWRDLADTTLRVGKRVVKRGRDVQERELPWHFRAPPTPFNAPIDERRVFPHVQLPLPVLQQLRQAVPGSKLNDVVLAVVGGALRRYLHDNGELPVKSLVAMAPISRHAAGAERGGNQVSSMLVPLATDLADPLQRLARIGQATRVAKAYNSELGIETLFERLPAGGPALFLQGWRKFGLSRRVPPLFNVVVTNVPGSPVPLYLAGARMLSLTGMAGIYDGAALTMVITSYAGQVYIGITSAPDLLPDADHLTACIRESVEDLVRAAGQQPPARMPAARAMEKSLAAG